jgi:hypothetical protein
MSSSGWSELACRTSARKVVGNPSHSLKAAAADTTYVQPDFPRLWTLSPITPYTDWLPGSHCPSRTRTRPFSRRRSWQLAKAVGEDQRGRGGLQGYLVFLAKTDPKSFAGLLGKVLPMQITGKDDGAIQTENVSTRESCPPQPDQLSRPRSLRQQRASALICSGFAGIGSRCTGSSK